MASAFSSAPHIVTITSVVMFREDRLRPPCDNPVVDEQHDGPQSFRTDVGTASPPSEAREATAEDGGAALKYASNNIAVKKSWHSIGTQPVLQL